MRRRTFTLTNTGSQPILFGGFGLISPSNDVSFGGVDTCTLLPLVEVDGQQYLSLAPGGACEIGVGMGRRPQDVWSARWRRGMTISHTRCWWCRCVRWASSERPFES